MADEFVVAVDAMGGDHAPGAIVRGAAIARERHPEARFLFFGPEAQIAPLVAREKKRRLGEASEIVDTPDVVAADAKVATALRQGRESTMRRAVNAVAEGRAACAISAGNTGALLAMSKVALKTLPGVDRPAIASLFPTRRGDSAMLDLGANIQVDARNLEEFAIMGAVFARLLVGLERPTVGLLNVGSEDQKGHDELREAHAVLSATTQLPFDYYGFIEGDGIAAGVVDVVVTDGFTGNVALKTAEGTSRLISEFIRQAFKHSLMAKLGYVFAGRAMGKLRARLDPRRYNGAMFLGLNGVVVKSHGGTDAIGFAHALGVAIDLVARGLADKIGVELESLHAERQAPPPVAA